MIYSTEFLSKARNELLAAWEWYEERQPGLGDKFKEEVYRCVRVMEKNPKRYPERKKTYREAGVKIFPYLVIYRIHERKKIIAIVSVFHTRRNPKKKYRNK
ncbi:MAG: type II toxin-antitoxin system RelE/ParE family toxin [Chitinophagaceae bacterium]